MIDERVIAICSEFDLEIVGPDVAPRIGQTRATNTIKRIIKRHGMERARFVIGTLAETNNNRVCINEIAIWAVNDVVSAAEKNFPHILTNDVELWYRFFDSLPLGVLQFWVLDLEGIISKRHALAALIYERMKRRFGDLGVQPDLLDDRAPVNRRVA